MKLPPMPDEICPQCGRDAIFNDACGPSHAIRSEELVYDYGTACAKAALEAAREVIAKYPTTYGTADLVIRKLMESIK